MLNEFKNFLIKGNAVDMAVGFIFGAAFATVVKSFVDHIVMPPLGLLTSGVDFSNLKYILVAASEGKSEVAIGYGVFVNDFIAFILLGFVVFMMIKGINKLNKKADEEEKEVLPPKSPEVKLLEEIRDALVKK